MDRMKLALVLVLVREPPFSTCHGAGEAWKRSSMLPTKNQSQAWTTATAREAAIVSTITIGSQQVRCSGRPSLAPERSRRSRRTSEFSASQWPRWSKEEYCTQVQCNDSIGAAECHLFDSTALPILGSLVAYASSLRRPGIGKLEAYPTFNLDDALA